MGNSDSKPIKYLPAFEAGELPSLEHKVVAITGCTSGTGLVFAKVAVRKGAAAVLLLNRPSERATQAETVIQAEVPEGSSTKVETFSCDLQDFESVKAAAKTIAKKYDAIDVLCNNAGIMAMEEKATKDGFDVQTQTNHLSHFLLTRELLPSLKKAKEIRGEARIVNHSSLARKGGLLQAKYFQKDMSGSLGGDGMSGKWERYHQSKLAQPLFTLCLADKLKDTGIIAACAAPGYSATDLQKTSQGMNGLKWSRMMAQSAEDGTMPLLTCAFGKNVSNGDFWEPSKYMRASGPAAKFELGSECTDEASKNVLWEVSEAAVGKFEI